MAHRIVDENSLKTVADAIREKAGTSDSLVFPTGFAEAIAGIQAGGGGGGGDEITINGCKVMTGEYVSAEDLQNKTITIFEKSISVSSLVASLFYTSGVFAYEDKPFLSMSGGGLLEYTSSLGAMQTGYNVSGGAIYLSGGFDVRYMNGNLKATLNVSSSLRVPAGKKYQWIVLYK
jgi:hypothetical protein